MYALFTDDHSNRVLLDEFERKLKEAVDVRVASVEAESSRHLLERESQWLQEKAGMERRLNDAEEQVGILRRELDRSHPEVSPSRSSLGHSAAEDEKIALLAEDLDRANQVCNLFSPNLPTAVQAAYVIKLY